jgi:predicted dehydrogenase
MGVEMAELRVGIVGVGEHGIRSHIKPILEMPEARLAAVCDLDEARCREVAPAGAAIFTKYEDLIADSSIDAVIITTPDRFHCQQLAAAIAAGKHVLVEKPIAERHEDMAILRATLSDAEKRGLVVSSCHPRRFDPPFLWMRDNLDRFRDDLGAVTEMRFDLYYHRPSKHGLHHGLLIDHLGHEIDLMHWLLGYQGFWITRLFDSETRYSAAGIRSDDVAFVFGGNRSLERYTYGERLAIRFERGEVGLDTESGRATILDFESGAESVESCGKTDYEMRFGDLNRNFVRACLGQTDSYLRTLDMMVNTEAGIMLTPGANALGIDGGDLAWQFDPRSYSQVDEPVTTLP